MKYFKVILTTALLFCITAAQAQKYVGGDISLLTRYEDNGANYMDKDGKKITDVLAFLKEQGMNAMRVRLFVDPSLASDEDKGEGVCQDIEFVKRLGKKIKDAGLMLMLDFHYSDTWADPGQQATPQLFFSVNTPAYNYIYHYTKESLEALVKAGATPDFIQTGNEITYGMMWDSGCKVEANSAWDGYKDDNWENFTTALKNAGKACREVCPDAKIIIHTERVPNPPQIIDFYKKIDKYGVDYDIIGTSYYPYHHGNVRQLDKAITEFESNFPSKDIMVVETGCDYHYEMVKDENTGYPLTYEGQRQFTEDLITTLNKHKQVNGLFWWFLEANEYGLDWKTQRVTDGWYNASLFDNETGKALPALYELKNFNDSETGIQEVRTEAATDNDTWYSLDGRKLYNAPHQKGLYIKSHQKVILR